MMKRLSHIDLLALRESLSYKVDNNGQTCVFDPLRRKHIRATPEEIVRQLWLVYLIHEIKLNKKLIAVERMFRSPNFVHRFDLVVFNKQALPVLLAEFKSPGIPISQSTFDQIARYNMELQVPYALVSNGRDHYCFNVDEKEKKYNWLESLPF